MLISQFTHISYIYRLGWNKHIYIFILINWFWWPIFVFSLVNTVKLVNVGTNMEYGLLVNDGHGCNIWNMEYMLIYEIYVDMY